MKVIILAAGQGRRLLPWTHHRPKCLLPFAGRSLLAWQLRALATTGVDEAVVVTGFGAEQVEAELARERPNNLRVSTLYNPFFGVSDNIASCWAARDHLHGELMILNGDMLFEPAIVTRLRAGARASVTVTTDVKASYDADDMKVQIRGGAVARIGKTLPPEATDAESIGLVYLRGLGGPLFASAVDSIMRQPRGVARWFVAAVDELAGRGMVAPLSISGLDWTEIDYPGDLGRAELLACGWMHEERRQQASLAVPW